MNSLDSINQLQPDEAKKLFLNCCSSQNWAQQLQQCRPFATTESLLQQADECWQNLCEKDYLEAFSGHPRIGDVDSLRQKFSQTKTIAAGEQQLVNEASEETINELAKENEKYYSRFGFIFIVFASGKSAEEMLLLLKQRLNNVRRQEILIAAQEQRKIFRKRLLNLLEQNA